MLSLADIGPQTLIASKRLVSSACMLCVVFSLLIRRGHLMQSSDPRVRTDLSGATAGKRAARDAAEAPSSEHKDAGCAGGETQREGEREGERERERAGCAAHLQAGRAWAAGSCYLPRWKTSGATCRHRQTHRHGSLVIGLHKDT